jgi:hypothetical protein
VAPICVQKLGMDALEHRVRTEEGALHRLIQTAPPEVTVPRMSTHICTGSRRVAPVGIKGRLRR